MYVCVFCVCSCLLCVVCMLLCVVCVCFSCVCFFICCTHKEIYMCCVCVLVCDFTFFTYMLMKWKRKCVIIYREYSLKLNRLKTTAFLVCQEKMLKRFSKREENLSGNRIYICIACFRIKTKKHQTHPCHTLLTQSYFRKNFVGNTLMICLPVTF